MNIASIIPFTNNDMFLKQKPSCSQGALELRQRIKGISNWSRTWSQLTLSLTRWSPLPGKLARITTGSFYYSDDSLVLLRHSVVYYVGTITKTNPLCTWHQVAASIPSRFKCCTAQTFEGGVRCPPDIPPGSRMITGLPTKSGSSLVGSCFVFYPPIWLTSFVSSLSKNLDGYKCHWSVTQLSVTPNAYWLYNWWSCITQVRLCKKFYNANRIIEFFVTREWRFVSERPYKIHARMSEVDRNLFCFDVRLIDWKAWIPDYVAGMRRYTLHDKPETLPLARKRLRQYITQYLEYRLTKWNPLSICTQDRFVQASYASGLHGHLALMHCLLLPTRPIITWRADHTKCRNHRRDFIYFSSLMTWRLGYPI